MAIATAVVVALTPNASNGTEDSPGVDGVNLLDDGVLELADGNLHLQEGRLDRS